MDHVLNWIWQGSILAIGATVVLKWLDGSRAHVRHLVCWFALLSVLAIPLLSWWPLTTLPPGGTAAAPDGILLLPGAWWTSTALAASLWVAWCAFHAARYAAAARAVRRARHEATGFPAALEARLPFWCSVRGLGRGTALVVSDRVRSAGVLGGRSPVIAVAPLLLERLDTDALDRVVVHEWAHAQRFDDLTHSAQLLIWAVAGWHPAVWWLDRHLRIEREVACDEAAVAVTGCSKSYAACLTTLATVCAGRRQAVPALNGLGSTALRTRVTRLLSTRSFMPTVHSKRVAAAGVMGLIALSVILADIRLADRAPAWAIRALPARLIGFVPDRTLPAMARVPAGTAQDVAAPGDIPASSSIGPGHMPNVAAPAHLAAVQRSVGVVTHAPALRSDRTSMAVPLSASSDAAPSGAVTTLPVAPPDAVAAAVPATGEDGTEQSVPARERPDVGPSTPWAAAADAGAAIGERSQAAGAAIGERSQAAGAATGAFFGRLGRRIAKSF